MLGVVLGAGQRGMLGQGCCSGLAGREGEQEPGAGDVKLERASGAVVGLGAGRAWPGSPRSHRTFP